MAVRDVVQAAAGALGGEALYVEDVFSTYLYTGNGSTQTITNNIDLSGEGGLVWFKARNQTANNALFDTERGANVFLKSNATDGNTTRSALINSYNSNGFTLGNGDIYGITNYSSSYTYASWTFRKAPKFFDVVTWTGDGVSGKTVAHNLGSAPGAVIIKRTDSTSNWTFWHRSLSTLQKFLRLNLTDAEVNATFFYNASGTENVAPTDSVITLGSSTQVNASGGTYVAYLFAHNAGGFGADGTEDVISCGSYTGTGSEQFINLGWEPQWVLVKSSSYSGLNWYIVDNMRGSVYSDTNPLFPNVSDVEDSGFPANRFNVNATGFSVNGSSPFNISPETYIYIAIRRGPMAVPTLGTSVFAPAISTNNLPAWSTGFPVDMGVIGGRTGSDKMYNAARLMGETSQLKTNTTDAAASWLGTQRFDQMNGYGVASTWGTNYMGWMFRRAPGFFDVVCYTGDDVNPRTLYHNLNAVPELLIFKCRNVAGTNWKVHLPSALGNFDLSLDLTNAAGANSVVGNLTETSFTLSSGSALYNDINDTYVAYLFATLAGVSKVGSYTGTTSDINVDCGFSAGARFVLIKRTDSTGDWYVWDSARGIVAGNDPYLLLNSAAAEVTTTDYIDPYSAGFTVTSTAPAALNASGGTYIFLAIA